MAFADSNRASLRYIAEDPNAWGVTPASGKSRELRITGSQLAYNKETQTSQELRSDRMIPNIIEVGASSEGSIDFEFSAGAMDDFLAAFVYGLWSRPMTMDFFSGVGVRVISASAFSVAGDVRDYLTVGRFVKSEGFLGKSNNAYAKITALAFADGQTTITTDATNLVIEAGTTMTRVYDANDILVSSTGLAFLDGAITSKGSNLFGNAVAAGQIKFGQKLHIDGIGFETATVTLDAIPTAGDVVTITDGNRFVNFQFEGVVPAGNVKVDIGASAETSAANLEAAIRRLAANGKLEVTATVTGAVVTVTNLAEVSGGSVTKLAGSGADITIVDFAGADDSVRGVFTVTSVADDKIGLSPAPADNANVAGKRIVIKGSMLRNPSRVQDFVRQSFTVETSYEDVQQHFLARGLRVGSFELNVSSGEIVGGSVEMMGTGMERQKDQKSRLRSGSYVTLDSTANEIMNATTNVGNLSANGVALATALQSLSISGDASLRAQNAVGSKFPRGIGVGRFALTGSFTAYFETGELFDTFSEHETMSLGFFFMDKDGIRYDVTLPAIKLTSDPISPSGIDEDVVEEIDWEAQRDPATSCMIQFDRFSSVSAPTSFA